MTSDLVPVGELKPRDFFNRRDNELRMKMADDKSGNTWFARKTQNGFVCSTIDITEMVVPLPSCDSFDWQPPREPTALELALKILSDASMLQPQLTRVKESLIDLIRAMEREAAK